MKKFFPVLLLFQVAALPAQILTPQSAGIKLTHAVLCTPVKDQSLSSTCWSFASTAFLESEALRRGFSVDLSEMYIARFSYLNKVKEFLAKKGAIYFTPGGQFHDAAKVIKEHGLVPEEAYNGRPNGEAAHNHEELDSAMTRCVKRLLRQGKTAPSDEDMKYINGLLDHHLGKVPTTFVYKGSTYTPQTFAQNLLRFNADDYVEITSYTHYPWYHPFMLEDKYNWSGDAYYNLPLNEFCAVTDWALKNNFPVGWDGDVQEEGFAFANGVAWLPDTIIQYAAFRQRSFEDKSTALDHMMQIAGTATDSKNRKWYWIKNSWGDNSNGQKGFLFMQEAYFKIKTVAIIVNKKAIPADIRKKLRL